MMEKENEIIIFMFKAVYIVITNYTYAEQKKQTKISREKMQSVE